MIGRLESRVVFDSKCHPLLLAKAEALEEVPVVPHKGYKVGLLDLPCPAWPFEAFERPRFYSEADRFGHYNHRDLQLAVIASI
jgi:hypothetical protein